MDLSEKNNKSGMEKRGVDDRLGFLPPGVSADWQRLVGNSPFLPDHPSMAVFHEDQMGSSSFPSAAAAMNAGWNLHHPHADSSFIERAARFSCFNPAGFPETPSPFAPMDLLNPRCNPPRGFAGVMAAPASSPKPLDHRGGGGSPIVDAQEKNNDMGEDAAEFSSEELGPPRTRRRAKQDMELGEEIGGEMAEPKTSKPSGKQPKDGSGGSEASKEEYIHVRARRGQATNSHSLAERVRREKISQRMKLLQDLVPGCSKVTGKAVMLDEIINYVQSLQRQVEFLSMKLATVNPRLDMVDIESLLSKDLLQCRGGSSSAIGLSSEAIRHRQFQQTQQVLIQNGIAGVLNPSDALGRTMNAQLAAMGGHKEQMPAGPWDEEELNNVLQMNFGPKPPLNP